jgi:peptide/nickel transport system substrate-binding protein
VVGESGPIPTTNPATTTAGSTHAYWEIMYNGLLALDGAGNPVPELATVVPTFENGGISDAGRTYTFTLRDDVYWHDDDPTGLRRKFTSADVKFSFEKALLVHHGRTKNMAPFLSSWDANAAAQVASIDALDPVTVRFRFTNPYAPLLKQLNVTEAPMLPAHRFSGNPTLAVLNANVIGTGPFKCADPAAAVPCRSGTDAKVVRNPAYFRTGAPLLDEIIMRPLTDATTRKNALRKGDVDWVWDVPEQFVAEVQADTGIRTAPTQSLGGGPNSIDTLIFNITAPGDRAGQIGGPNPTGTAAPHPILGDVNVRKAIFHAINRPAVLAARFGIGKVAIAPISSELPQHATDINLPAFDSGAANALLDAAGWNGPRITVNGVPNIRTAMNHPRRASGGPRVADGAPLTVDFLIGNTSFDARMAVIDANLAAVGVDLNRLAVDTNATNKVFIERTFDTHFINLAQGYDPQIGIRRSYHSDQVTATTFTNAAGYKNSIVDNAFDQGVKTLDPGARFNLYRQFQAQVALDVPMVPLIETPNVRGFNAKCSGFKEYTGLFAETASCQR